ncbi:response regulator transcription factor [bacterium]|nr:response regulator transcription factor [bacterium]
MPGCEILILSIHESAQLVEEAVALGARGYVSKGDSADDLLRAVDVVGHHEPFFSSRINHALLGEQARGREPLTAREREVLCLIAAGNSSKQAAARLGISLLTVETHRARIMRKLKLRSVANLVRYAVRMKMIEP